MGRMMYRVLLEIKAQPPPYLAISPPPSSTNIAPDNKISPSILLIIIILSIIFFISGLLHLLVRCLLRPPNREPEESDNTTALQGQLRQLFHLHDSGVDQSFIDTLPVFLYKAIIGVKDPFDCAVCLCEFEADDKLRLLPKCCHAFHLECIDTWLLSHSTCPLCRGSLLLPDFSPAHSCSPIVLVLESRSESSREIVADREAVSRAASALGEEESGIWSFRENTKVSIEIETRDQEAKVVPVKLGKFRNVDGASSRIEGSAAMNDSTSHVDGRRCFSMGSFEYVMDDNSLLQVPIRPHTKKQVSRRPPLPLTPGHRPAMSVCDCHSSRDGFTGFEVSGDIVTSASNHGADKIRRSKRDSFSISKIWLRGPKTQKERASTADSNRRAISFRFPVSEAVVGDETKAKAKASATASECSNSGSGEFDGDEEVGSCNSLASQANTPSFARRTMLWLASRQNKVVHSSATSQA